MAGRAARDVDRRPRAVAAAHGSPEGARQGHPMVVGGGQVKTFVAGATGVVGRRAVERLVAAGHDVTAVARTAEKADLVRALGARPVTVDLFDRDALVAAVAGHDVVVNLATHIPAFSQAALPGAWKENDRIRGEASRNLV